MPKSATYIVPAGPPSDKPINTLGEIKTIAHNRGSKFFTPGTLRFFKSHVSENVYPTPYGTFFVTSERSSGYTSRGVYDYGRRYTVRFMAATTVQTPREWNGEAQWVTSERGELVDTSADAFGKYASGNDAHAAAKRMQQQFIRPVGIDVLEDALRHARRALEGDSNDAEHEALFGLVEAVTAYIASYNRNGS